MTEPSPYVSDHNDRFAHVQDSLAPAEHLRPDDILAAIEALGPDYANSPKLLLDRASLLVDYAIATPESEGDEGVFSQATADLIRILGFNRGQRDPIDLGARLMLASMESFRRRATLPQSITGPVRRSLQRKIGDITDDFIHAEPTPLTDKQLGRLAELVAYGYILHDEDLFPFLATYREERNMLPGDNHDFSTLHPCGQNRVKKVPISIKYREMPLPGNRPVVTLTVGRMALDAVRSIPPYSLSPEFPRNTPEPNHAGALLLAANILICHTSGDELSTEDKAFQWLLTAYLVNPIKTFAELPTTPDYASNAAALQAEIAARQQRLQQPRPGG